MSSPSSTASLGFDARPLVGVQQVLRGHRPELRARRERVIRLRDPRPLADHLAERPERESVAVGRRPSLVRVDGRPPCRRCTSRAPRRGGSCRCPAGPVIDTRASAGATTGGLEEDLLDHAQVVVAAHERGARGGRRGRTPRVAPLREPRARPATGADLPLNAWVRRRARSRWRPRWRARSPRRRGRSRGRSGLHPGGRVDEVPGDERLTFRTEGRGSLSGQHAGPARPLARPAPHRRGAQGSRAVDEIQGRPDGALGIVLSGQRACPRRPSRRSPMNFSTTPP